MNIDVENKVIAGLFIGLFIAILLILTGGIVAIHKESQRWEAFKIEHACKPVATIRGDVFTTVGPTTNGSVAIGIGSTPDKTGWLCNDGMTYYR